MAPRWQCLGKHTERQKKGSSFSQTPCFTIHIDPDVEKKTGDPMWRGAINGQRRAAQPGPVASPQLGVSAFFPSAILDILFGGGSSRSSSLTLDSLVFPHVLESDMAEKWKWKVSRCLGCHLTMSLPTLVRTDGIGVGSIGDVVSSCTEQNFFVLRWAPLQT